MPVPWCFDNHGLQCSWMAGSVIPPTPASRFVPSRVAWAIWGLPRFHVNFRVSCSKKNTIAILGGFALHLHIALGSVDMLMLLIPPTHGQGYSLPFICIFFTLFHVFCFQGTTPVFRIFGSVYSKASCAFGCICKWACLLAFPPGHLLLLYRNATDFCVSSLNPATLLNSFLSSNVCVCVWSL